MSFTILQADIRERRAPLDDYWTQQIGTAETPPDAALRIETIEGVEPLDAQFGAVAPKTVGVNFIPLIGQLIAVPAFVGTTAYFYLVAKLAALKK